MTKAELIEKLDGLKAAGKIAEDVTYSDENTNAELAALLPPDEPQPPKPPAQPEPDAAKKDGKKKFYWIKKRAHADKGKVLESGLYELPDNPRLNKIGFTAVQSFDGPIETVDLHEIAKWAGIDPVKSSEGNKRTYKSDEELMSMLLKR